MTYDKLSRYYANQREQKLRELLRRQYGTGKYRITKSNEVHAHTSGAGWLLVGHRLDVERDFNLR